MPKSWYNTVRRCDTFFLYTLLFDIDILVEFSSIDLVLFVATNYQNTNFFKNIKYPLYRNAIVPAKMAEIEYRISLMKVLHT